MQILITRPMVLCDASGTRALVPGLTVDLDAASAGQLLQNQAGILIKPAEAAEPATSAAHAEAPAEAPSQPRRRKAADAQA